ncbi:hypothetical protein BL127_00025785 [Raoultella planticola]|nr:hypothetical protein BL127_00025785 [Raoultella planticola]
MPADWHEPVNIIHLGRVTVANCAMTAPPSGLENLPGVNPRGIQHMLRHRVRPRNTFSEGMENVTLSQHFQRIMHASIFIPVNIRVLSLARGAPALFCQP